jgi:cytochrome c7-like protein
VAQVFRPAANTIALLVIASLGAAPVLLAGLGYSLMKSPYVTDQSVTREQPVPFSHAHHVGGLGLDCRYCHTSVTTARFAGIPPTETCMTCHSQLWTNAAMLAPVRESLATNTPIHWQRVHVLPDYVYFDHSIHIAKGVGCSTCHGAVDRMPLMRQAAPLTMGWCLDCHRHPEKAIRPLDKVFDMKWTPPKKQLAEGRRLMSEYHIDTAHLTDCTKCHR